MLYRKSVNYKDEVCAVVTDFGLSISVTSKLTRPLETWQWFLFLFLFFFFVVLVIVVVLVVLPLSLVQACARSSYG